MKNLIIELQKICQLYPLREKVMIVDSHSIGEDILEAYLKYGHDSVNLTYKTVRDLAVNKVELCSTHPCTYIEQTVGVHLTYQLLKKLKEANQFRYFFQLEITPTFSKAVYQTIQHLRLAGFTSTTLTPKSFLSPEKEADMVLILASFEELLKDMDIMDDAALYRKALHANQKNFNTIFILQSNLDLSALEEQFLIDNLNNSVFKLPLEHVYGINVPERSNMRSIAWKGESPLSYLYQLEDSQEKAKLSVMIAKSEEIEVKNVFSQLKQKASALDEAVVFYCSQDPYVTLFYQLSEKIEIPITFGEGIPISFTRPGRLVSGIIEWIQSNYSVTNFLNLINENVIQLEKGVPSKAKITTYLRSNGIGWGKERYFTGLQVGIDYLNEKIAQTEDPIYLETYQKTIQELSQLKLFFKRMFNQLPNMGPEIHFQSLLEGIEYVLKNFSNPQSKVGQMAKATLIDELRRILPYSDEIMGNYDAFEKVKDLLLGVRVNKSRPQPGHLHVSSFKSGIYQSRMEVFVLGLDNQKFPGDSSENPLLLDAERRMLGAGLPLLGEKGQENIYTMLQVLAQTQGHVSVSFSNFDINQNRKVSPAHLFLQCYRMITGKFAAEFNDLNNIPVLSNSTVIEIKDYWLTKLNSSNLQQLGKDLLHQFPNIENGERAEAARNTEAFTPFDGCVAIDQQKFDPRKNSERRMTAGKLETLARCPYSYFLQEILRVRPVEDVCFEPYRWLDPATRGSLLHRIFELFYKKMIEDGYKPSFETHKEMILHIAQSLIEQQMEVVPPPSDRIFKKEAQDIYDCCLIFLKEEEEYCKNYSPQYFEYTFGIGDIEPAKIRFPSGEVMNVSGKIDRVDQTSAGAYHIIDYKTGSTYGYGMNKPFKGGRQLQHYVYAIAIEQHLQLDVGKVVESSYYFPTTKGIGHRFSRIQDEQLRTNGLDLLEKLVDLIRTGHFTMTDDPNDCKYCNFQSACRRSLYDPAILELKQMDQTVQGLKNFRGFRSYE